MTPAGDERGWEREALATYLARRPYTAAQLGTGLTDATTVPIAPGDREELAARAASVLTRSPQAPHGVAPLTVEVVRRTLESDQLALSVPWHDYTVSALPEAGISAQVLLFLPYATLGDPDALGQYEMLCAAVPRTLTDAVEALERGHADGRRPVADLIPKALDQVESYLASPTSEDVFLAPVRQVDPAAVDRLEAMVRDRIRPAFAAYGGAVRRSLAGARSGDHAGLCWIPGGDEFYGAAIKEFTTVDVDAVRMHDLGLALVDDLRRNVEGLARELGWDPRVDSVLARLRTDPRYRFTSRSDIVAAARSALRRAQAGAPEWVGDIGDAPCEVLPMSELEERSGVIGHYEVAPLDRSRPARYWVNTSEPGTRFTFEAEALAFHESVPGHHVELTSSLRAPHGSLFRQVVGVMPYTEGWGLYAERLADEMGLYTSPLHRLGMLSFGLWRASRLVVDSGLHAYGWPRRRGVEFLDRNTALSPRNIANEVDRYIAHPGSALAYQLGERVLRTLRDHVVRSHDQRALRHFHQDLLSAGPLPLPLLAESFGMSIDTVLKAMSCGPT